MNNARDYLLLLCTSALSALVFVSYAHGVNKNVDLTISTVKELALSNDTTTATLSTSTSGDIDAQTVTFVQYAYSTNATNQTLKASTQSTIPTGMTVELNATAPTSGGTSAGWISLTATDQNLVTGIGASAEGTINVQVRIDGTVETPPNTYNIQIDFTLE